MKLYVDNLSQEATEEDLRHAFGPVTSATIVKDRFSGESRGFDFVEMPAKAEAQAAIAGLNGKELKGRTSRVNEARPRSEGRRGGGGFGRRRPRRASLSHRGLPVSFSPLTRMGAQNSLCGAL